MGIGKNIIFVGVLIVGFLLGFFFEAFFPTHTVGSCVTNEGLTLINPKLDCNGVDEKIKRLDILEDKLKIAVDSYQNTGQAKRIAVFVRDLDSLRFAGVNDSEVFYMASLLKLPLIIAGYKLAEIEPGILTHELVFNGEVDEYDIQHSASTSLLVKGNSYTIKDLMNRAIIHSENAASKLLFDYYPPEFLDRILQALAVQIRLPEGGVENPITARTYATILRTLYNGSYLTREYSNDVLTLLTNVEYRTGAVAKLPSNVTVAHKFAEREVVDEVTGKVIYKQLHECGIVYAKNATEPYTFCIMTEGSPNSDLEKIQQDISLNIYNTMVDEYGGGK